ncbi:MULTISPECIES: hypothetical protein [Streptomyces]
MKSTTAVGGRARAGLAAVVWQFLIVFIAAGLIIPFVLTAAGRLP